MKHWVFFPVLALVCITVYADFYRWVDADGEIHYSDQAPPANAKQVEKIKAAGGKPSDPPLPYALRQAVTNFPVTLYTTECGDPCTRAGELLAKRGIPYTEMDAKDSTTQEELKSLTGGVLEVPLLKVGRDLVRGFEEGRWNTYLDAAGYPVTAVIPSRPPIKPAKPPGTAPEASPASPPPSAEAAQ